MAIVSPWHLMWQYIARGSEEFPAAISRSPGRPRRDAIRRCPLPGRDAVKAVSQPICSAHHRPGPLLTYKGSLELATPGDSLSSIAPARDAPSSPLGGTVAAAYSGILRQLAPPYRPSATRVGKRVARRSQRCPFAPPRVKWWRRKRTDSGKMHHTDGLYLLGMGPQKEQRHRPRKSRKTDAWAFPGVALLP